MSSSVIDLGRTVRDLTQSDELAEYNNVELQTDNEHSVYAKYFGPLIPDNNESFIKVHGAGQSISFLNGNDIYFQTYQSTTYGMGAFSNPAIATYKDLEGRTVHFEADVIIGANTTGNVVINAYFRGDKEATSNAGVDIKRIGLYSENTHVSFDFIVGDWIETTHPNYYLCFAILIASEDAGAFSVDNIQYYAVAENDNTLVAYCPFADSVLARRVLALVQGFHYRPYEAPGARIDMAAEIGDVIRIDGTGFGLYEQSILFGADCVSSLSAPFDQELEHEFPYIPSSERRFRREIKTIRADLEIKADEISAKVSQTAGSAESFGWQLLLDRWSVSANGREVFRINANGAYVYGEIVATKGTIGGCIIENGVLQVSGGNITNINASSITAGTLNVDRIQAGSISSGKLSDGAVTEGKIAGLAVTEGKIGGSAVTTGKIAGGAVTYGKTGFTGTLDQVGTNKSDIAAIKSYFLNILTVNSLTVQGNLYVYDSGGTSYAFRPVAFAQGTIRHILGSST